MADNSPESFADVRITKLPKDALVVVREEARRQGILGSDASVCRYAIMQFRRMIEMGQVGVQAPPAPNQSAPA